MLGTLFSLIIGAMLLFATATLNQALLTVTMVVVGSLFVLLFAAVHTFSWAPLQKVEQNMTPRLLDLYSADGHIKFLNLWFIFFPLASFAMATTAVPFEFLGSNGVLVIWLLMLGITFDAFIHLCRRVVSYLNPFSIVKHLDRKALEAIQSEDQAALCHWIEALGEIGTKAVERLLPTLCTQVVDSTYLVAREYLLAAKSITHHVEEKSKDHVDQVSYILFYLFQQMEQIHDRAVEKRLETLSGKLVTTLGKIAIASGQYDLTMTSYPLHYLGKFATTAQSRGCSDVVEKSTCTLVEVGKALVAEVDIRYQNLQEPFFSLLSHLDTLAKERFQQNKQINLQLLTLPFEELKNLFADEATEAFKHQDRGVIVAQIDTILNRFEQLEAILKTVPPISPVGGEPAAEKAEL